MILNVHATNNRAPEYMNQKLLELRGETDKSTNTTTNRQDLPDIYRAFYSI